MFLRLASPLLAVFSMSMRVLQPQRDDATVGGKKRKVSFVGLMSAARRTDYYSVQLSGEKKGKFLL